MKKLIFILLIFPFFGLSQRVVNAYQSFPAAGSTANWDIFEESFEATDYDYSGGYTENLGTNEGNILDPNDITITPPTGGGSKSLHTFKDLTPTASEANVAIYTGYLPSEHPITYTEIYYHINDYTFAADNLQTIFALRDALNAFVITISVRLSGGYLKIFAQIVGTSDVYYPAAANIPTGEWVHIQVMYDATNELYELIVNDVSASSGTLSLPRNGVKRIYIGDSSYDYFMDANFDLFRISSTNF